MQVIKETPALNAGRMAQKLGISNGAVSQTLARLERKRMINKTKDPALKNELTVTFTESGRAALQGFEREQASAMNIFSSYLSGLSSNDRSVIERFLAHMEDLLKKLE
ncbi:MAG: MarR family transcriptional regulator [Deltaproteobacteria bacterium]|nr:MarR family transcriptional regulator [Deltaproteobacteria bacterium]